MLRFSALKEGIRGIAVKAGNTVCAALFACAFLGTPVAAQSTFTVQSVPDLYTAVFVDSEGRTITVRSDPQNDFCTAINAAGYAGAFARSSVAACDRTLHFDFETSGFLVQSITYSDIDDADGTAPRDSFAMNVAGTWTSPTIEVHSFASPPTFADQAGRLSAAGGVGTFLANSAGDNPVDETATFTMATATTQFRLLFDDTEGERNALVYFDLDNMVITFAQGSIVPFDDTASVTSSAGGTAVVNAYAGDTLNNVSAAPINTNLALAPGESLPTGFTFDTNTGDVSVAAGTPVGTYSFDYQICEVGFSSNCEIGTVTVTVTGSLDLSITKTNGTTEVFSGSTTTYTLMVTHGGGDAITGAVVSDTPGAGLSCDAADPVTITGDGVPSGTFTIADLVGGGIALDTLSSGQSTTLTYSCQVN